MIKETIEDKITNNFLEFLEESAISSKTLKNYKSDISHFSAWIIFKIRSYGVLANNLSDSLPFIKNELVNEYKDFLVENKESFKTINRRLSTLRHLAKFLLESQIVSFDFMNGIYNLRTSKDVRVDHDSLVLEFQKHLEKENVSKNTIKNYLSDVRQFINWLEAQNSLRTN